MCCWRLVPWLYGIAFRARAPALLALLLLICHKSNHHQRRLFYAPGLFADGFCALDIHQVDSDSDSGVWRSLQPSVRADSRGRHECSHVATLPYLPPP
jgi:hypothetical protein